MMTSWFQIIGILHIGFQRPIYIRVATSDSTNHDRVCIKINKNKKIKENKRLPVTLKLLQQFKQC